MLLAMANPFKTLGLLALTDVALAANPCLSPTAAMPPEASTETRVLVALALRTPSCGEPLVDSLSNGDTVSQSTVIAYPTAEEASAARSWTHELEIINTLLALATRGEAPSMDSVQYQAIDGNDPHRFLEPGTNFVLTDDHQLNARRATVDGRDVWLADSLPAACFASTPPRGDSMEKICFVPLTTDTAASR